MLYCTQEKHCRFNIRKPKKNLEHRYRFRSFPLPDGFGTLTLKKRAPPGALSKRTHEKTLVFSHALFNVSMKFELFTHLSCNLSCEVLILLLKTFASLETNEALNFDVSAVLFSNLCYILSYGLLAVLCFYVNLV